MKLLTSLILPLILPLIMFILPMDSFSAEATKQADSDASLRTISEQSGFKKTGRYDEVIRLCDAFQTSYPKQVRCESFGTTPEGRPMMMLIATRTGAFTAQQARQRHIPVVLIQGGIHAGEIDGKDAGFLALRETLQNKAAPGALEKQVFLFVPVFNVDGHERYGAWNRPNQVGPEEMGWRTTAQNLNLNRDYTKAVAPEMQAMLHLVNTWDPLAYIDLHVTDGAKFQHDISIQIDSVFAGDDSFRQASTLFRNNVIADLAAQGSMPLSYYPSFKVYDDPSSGFESCVAPARLSSGYFWLRNRFSMLVETHSWKDYPTRVRITHNTIISILNQIAIHGADWMATVSQADLNATKLAKQPVELNYQVGPESHLVQFQGYAYTREHSDISGGLMTRYDDTRPQVWEVPLRDNCQPSLTVTAPGAGYIVPAAQAAFVGTKLSQHGISYRVLKNTLTDINAQTFRADKTTFSPVSFEGHQALKVEGQWKNEKRRVTAGALFVPIDQPKARLLMALLEPQAADSLLAWGEFNLAFEQKEYMEDYVAEDVARAQLAADPQLAETFKHKLESDPEFAKNPAARLQFFARRHASWDERFNLYPVLRIDTAPQ